MSFHLVGPELTTTGKKRGKKKFANAKSKQTAAQNKASWEALLKKYEVKKAQPTSKKIAAMAAKPYVPPKPAYRRDEGAPVIPSAPFTGAPCAAPEKKVYTGTNIKGIGVMHKSNAVPIFTDQEAKDIASMRR